MSDDDAYLAHRGLVLRLAYDITASWADAEDVAQQTWVRWRTASDVRNPRAYLATIATHLALDVVAQRERAGYPGTFLPEPVPTGPAADDALSVAAEVEIALMLVLGSLSPLERAVFLLHDVFAFTHVEVAEMVGRTPAAVRQLASRARHHVDERRPEPTVANPAEVAALTDSFLAAARRGDLTTLMSHLTEDAVFVGDGGGKRASALRPVEGREKVARLFVGLADRLDDTTHIQVVEVNRRPALIVHWGGELDQVLWLVLRDGLIAQALVVRNPDKLHGIEGLVGNEPS